MPSLNVVFTGDAKGLNRTISATKTKIAEMQREVAGHAARGVGEFAVAAAGVYGVSSAIDKTVESAKELVTTSKRLDMTVEQLQVLRQAAADSGVQFDRMAAGLEKIDVARAHALGGGKDAAKYLQAFQSLGVSAADLKQKTAADLFTGPLAATIRKTNPEEIAGPLHEVFGRGFGEFVPVMKQDFDELGEKMRAAGAIMDGQVAAKLAKISNEFEILSRIVTTQLAPALLKFAEWAYSIILKGGGQVAGMAATAGSMVGQAGWWKTAKALFKTDVIAIGGAITGTDEATQQKQITAALASEGINRAEVWKATAAAEDPWKKRQAEFEKMLADAAKSVATPPKPDFTTETGAEVEPKKPKTREAVARQDLTENQRIGAYAMVQRETPMIDLARQQIKLQEKTVDRLDKLVAKPSGGIPGYG